MYRFCVFLERLPALQRRYVEVQQLVFIVVRIDLPLVGRGVQVLLKIPVEGRRRGKAAFLRDDVHRIVAFSHVVARLLDADQVQVFHRRHVEIPHEHAPEMRLAHVAEPRELTRRNGTGVVLVDVVERRRDLLHVRRLRRSRALLHPPPTHRTSSITNVSRRSRVIFW